MNKLLDKLIAEHKKYNDRHTEYKYKVFSTSALDYSRD